MKKKRGMYKTVQKKISDARIAGIQNKTKEKLPQRLSDRNYYIIFNNKSGCQWYHFPGKRQLIIS